jgi:hypothetical protein
MFSFQFEIGFFFRVRDRLQTICKFLHESVLVLTGRIKTSPQLDLLFDLDSKRLTCISEVMCSPAFSRPVALRPWWAL